MLETIEPLLIIQHRSHITQHGYNLKKELCGANWNSAYGINDGRFRPKTKEERLYISQRTKKAMSEPAIRQRLSEATLTYIATYGHHMQGRKHRQESKQKMSDSTKAMSDETKKRIGEASRRAWEKRKNRANARISFEITHADGRVEVTSNLIMWCHHNDVKWQTAYCSVYRGSCLRTGQRIVKYTGATT